MSDLAVAATPVSGALYTQVQHFYARQMQLLDRGAVAEWAATFTDDGVFATAGAAEPVRGRADIARAAGAAAAARAEAGVVHRHWLGMLQVDGRADGTLLVRCYALVVAVSPDGRPALHRSTLCEDVLVPAAGGWSVRHRLVSPDGAAG